MTQRFTREQPQKAPQTATPILVEIEAEYVPLLFSALEKYHNPKFWVSPADYDAGLQGVIRLEQALLQDMSTQIVEAIDRLYRLVDNALNGRVYTPDHDPQNPTVPIITPEIPVVPPTDEGVRPGLRRQLLDAQGVINAGWFGIGGQAATLADVVEALRVGTPQAAERIDSALELLQTGSSSATIFQTVRDLFSDTVNTGLEGATLGTLIAASIANAATQGILSGQLDRIIATLDGGGPTAPSDNLLQTAKDIETMLS